MRWVSGLRLPTEDSPVWVTSKPCAGPSPLVRLRCTAPHEPGGHDMTAQQTTRALATLYVTALSTGNKRRARVISHIMANGAGFYAADRKAQV